MAETDVKPTSAAELKTKAVTEAPPKETEQEAEIAAVEAPAEPFHHPGGVHHPDGYELVGIIQSNEDGTYFTLDDLHENVEIDDIHGASVSLERPLNPESKCGILRGRIIHDFSANLYIFRKNEKHRTHFKTALGHTSPTVI